MPLQRVVSRRSAFIGGAIKGLDDDSVIEEGDSFLPPSLRG
jgi:hypothetical protein